MTFRLCKCEEFQHLNCIKKWIKKGQFDYVKEKETICNYYFPIFFCNELIKKDENCNETFCDSCNCVYCNTFYPLEFKYFNKEDKKDKVEKLIDYQKPENSNYIILESFDYKYKDYLQMIKSIHVINLDKKDEIIIGNDINNDVILEHPSVNKQHAKIKYNNGKIILKDLNSKAGTLVLIQKDKLFLSSKEIFLQINKTLIEAKSMEKEEYISKKKNKESNYPFSNEYELNMQNIENNMSNNSLNQQKNKLIIQSSNNENNNSSISENNVNFVIEPINKSEEFYQ